MKRRSKKLMCQRALVLLLLFLSLSLRCYCRYLFYGEKTNVMCFVLCVILATGAYVFNLTSVADIQLQDLQ